MDNFNSTYPPNHINPRFHNDTPESHQAHIATVTEGHHSKMEGIRTVLHDIKENVKVTLQRDHHHGQDCAKRPQDGKTNPME